MDFALSSDQIAILEAIESLTKPYATLPANHRAFQLYSGALDEALDRGGFLDVAGDPELGPVTAALIVERIARLPYCTEVAATALIRPLLGVELPRPLCLLQADGVRRPTRFMARAASAVIVERDVVVAVKLNADDVEALPSLFAYPMGSLKGDISGGIRCSPGPDEVRKWWRVALAAEIAGLLKGALDSTVLYVTDRKQFGRPLGSFQGVRHRLAEASVRVNGTRWLALKAAFSGDPGDAALAALYAQESATSIVYDLHQFLGAMGMTLEHPLHLWTYRLKALLSELGGRHAQALAAAQSLWRIAESPSEAQA